MGAGFLRLAALAARKSEGKRGKSPVDSLDFGTGTQDTVAAVVVAWNFVDSLAGESRKDVIKWSALRRFWQRAAIFAVAIGVALPPPPPQKSRKNRRPRRRFAVDIQRKRLGANRRPILATSWRVVAALFGRGTRRLGGAEPLCFLIT